jgi:hypothetical protein
MGMPLPESDGARTEEKMNVTFKDANIEDQVIYGPPTDKSFYATEDDVSAIARFLERPVQIWNYTWTESGFNETTFDPWTLFLSDTRVQKKIDNFLFINCKLKLKFVVNCSPFLYGAVYVGYRPFLHTGENLQSTTGREVGFSQRPGFWIFPQDNASYEMELPFFWLRDWLQLTSSAEVSKMGLMRLKQYSTLMSANGATSSGVTITCFASAVDLHLSTPTTALSLQSKDEYGDGPVSGIASAVARCAGNFVKTPGIGKFARATEIGAGATSKIAKLFGFTNVPVIDDASPMKNLPYPHMASVLGSEPVSKLTLDPKQELTIDSRTVGLDGADEMTIPSIVTRKSYLTSFTWGTATSADTLLYNMAVTPSQTISNSFTGGKTMSFTPMSHLAEVFNNWRGDIEISFKVICSRFHRGRLRVTWDPIGPIATTSGITSTNVAYTKIVDIGEETDVVVRVPYMQAKKYLETYPASDGGYNLFQTSSFSNFTTANSTPTRYNGQLTVRVLNTLSAPIDTSSVVVLVFVRGCENLEFANPRGVSDAYSYFAIQSKDEIAPTTIKDDDVNLICYGESVNSLRSLLRRYTLYESYPLNQTDTTSVQSIQRTRFKKFPYSPGYNQTTAPYATQAKGIVAGGSNFYYTFCHMTPLAWFSGAYLGRRGSIRYAFNASGGSMNFVRSIKVYRSLSTIANLSSVSTANAGASASPADFMGTLFAIDEGSELEGVIQFDHDIQSGITVELPQYINNRFEICDPLLGCVGSAVDSSDRETYNLSITSQPSKVGKDIGSITKYVSMGTDFSFFFYLNAPMINLNNLGPGYVTPV